MDDWRGVNSSGRVDRHPGDQADAALYGRQIQPPAGLMKSWHSLPAMKAARSAASTGRSAASRSAEGEAAERSGKVIVRAVCWREWLRLT